MLYCNLFAENFAQLLDIINVPLKTVNDLTMKCVSIVCYVL